MSPIIEAIGRGEENKRRERRERKVMVEGRAVVQPPANYADGGVRAIVSSRSS